MPIDFFKEYCKTHSNKDKFGLCDDPPPRENPAYIDEVNTAEWIGIVNNTRKKEIDFFAIDHCVDVLRLDGGMESRCDGLLMYDSTIVFVELKDRGSKGWLKKGREQITITFRKFLENHDISDYTTICAYVCNKQRPLANTGNITEMQKFRDDTGHILRVQSKITV